MTLQDVSPEAPVGTSGSYSPISLSAAAADKVRHLMSDKGLAGAGLRVFVQGGGCAGLQYGMAFVTEGEEGDVVFPAEGLSIHVDPVSIRYVQGAHIDYQKTDTGEGFRIDNPNAAACAGCGQASGCAGAGDGSSAC